MDTPGKKKRVRLDHDERRALILAAAHRLLERKPYSEISMADLAEEAGVARGLLHHYFGSKRDLYLELVRDVVRVPILPLPEEGQPVAAEVWEVAVEGWLELVEANRGLWLAAVGAGAVGHDPEVEAIVDESGEVVAERALQALGVPEPFSTEVRAIGRAYGGFTEQVTREWLQRGRLTREQAKALLLRGLPLFLEALLPLIDPLSAERQ